MCSVMWHRIASFCTCTTIGPVSDSQVMIYASELFVGSKASYNPISAAVQNHRVNIVNWQHSRYMRANYHSAMNHKRHLSSTGHVPIVLGSSKHCIVWITANHSLDHLSSCYCSMYRHCKPISVDWRRRIITIMNSVRMGPERTGTPFPSFFGRRERRSRPFKTTRLMVKLQQAYVLASEDLAR